MLWIFTKYECIAINQSLQMYIATKENDFMLGLDPISFWKTTSKFDSALRHLATMIFKMKGHAAPVESLFSGMSYTKTKTCNHMNVENLKMFTMIRNDLARSIPDSEKKQRKQKKSGDDIMISTLTSSVVNVDDMKRAFYMILKKSLMKCCWTKMTKKNMVVTTMVKNF